MGSNVSIDPVQGTILLAFLSFVVKFMYDVKAMMKERNEEREKTLVETKQEHAREMKAIAQAMTTIAEKLTLMEDRTQWMVRRDRPPTPDGAYKEPAPAGRGEYSEAFRKPERFSRDSQWTPVKGVPIMEKPGRRKTGEDDDR